jgi:mono/diheme cytochrome c family protein
MRTIAILLTIFAVGFVVSTPEERRIEGQSNPEHGKYLVENVAMCIQCHTPRDEKGNLLKSQEFQGSPVPFLSPYPDSRWANTAPSIAGLPQYTSDEAVKLLTSGVARTGTFLRAPMPQFRMNEGDARDIVAYLKTIR